MLELYFLEGPKKFHQARERGKVRPIARKMTTALKSVAIACLPAKFHSGDLNWCRNYGQQRLPLQLQRLFLETRLKKGKQFKVVSTPTKPWNNYQEGAELFLG